MYSLSETRRVSPNFQPRRETNKCTARPIKKRGKNESEKEAKDHFINREIKLNPHKNHKQIKNN